jgi:hypothetical protein
MEQSGFAWNEKTGAAIIVESESVWLDYVMVNDIPGSSH